MIFDFSKTPIFSLFDPFETFEEIFSDVLKEKNGKFDSERSEKTSIYKDNDLVYEREKEWKNDELVKDEEKGRDTLKSLTGRNDKRSCEKKSETSEDTKSTGIMLAKKDKYINTLIEKNRKLKALNDHLSEENERLRNKIKQAHDSLRP